MTVDRFRTLRQTKEYFLFGHLSFYVLRGRFTFIMGPFGANTLMYHHILISSGRDETLRAHLEETLLEYRQRLAIRATSGADRIILYFP